MLVFMTNKVPFSAIFEIFYFFDADQEKGAISNVSTKNRNIWNTDLINMWILADEACRFTNFSNITS